MIFAYYEGLLAQRESRTMSKYCVKSPAVCCHTWVKDKKAVPVAA